MTAAIVFRVASFAAENPKDPQKPWFVTGVVVQESGEPMQGVDVVAATGIGTLRGGGQTKSKADGTFELWFGPGFHSKDPVKLQAATISPRKEGWFEANLHRQGDLLAAFQMPQGEIGWGDRTKDHIVLPGQPKKLRFVMKPAAQIKGVLTDDEGNPVRNKRVGVTGPALPPSSSVFAEVQTNEKGEFAFANLPTGYPLVIYTESRGDWREWPNVTVILTQPEPHKVRITRGRVYLNFSSSPALEVTARNTKRK